MTESKSLTESYFMNHLHRFKNTQAPHLAVLSVVIFTMLSTPQAKAENYDWINPVGGEFSDTENWSPDTAIPSSEDYIYFDAPGYSNPYTVTVDTNLTLSRIYSIDQNDVIIDLRNESTGYTLDTSWMWPGNGGITLRGGTTTVTSTFYTGNSGTGHFEIMDAAHLTVGGTSGFRLSGNAASGHNTFTVSGGSTLVATATGGFQIGTIAATGANDTSNNQFVVKDTGSSATFSGHLFIGVNSNENSMTISNGGQVTGLSRILLGAHSTTTTNSSNNSILITGAGSKLTKTSGGWFQVGELDNANSTGHTITVTDSGELVSGNAMYIYDPQSTLLVSNNGIVRLNSSTNRIYGKIIVNEGDFSANMLTLYDTSRVEVTGGEFKVTNTLTLTEAGARFTFDLNQPGQIDITGAFTVQGETYLDFLNFSTPGSYTLFTFGSSNASQGNILLGNLPEGFEGELDFNANSIVLNVIPEPASGVLFLGAMMAAGIFGHRRRS